MTGLILFLSLSCVAQDKSLVVFGQALGEVVERGDLLSVRSQRQKLPRSLVNKCVMLRDLRKNKTDLEAANFFPGLGVQRFLGPAWPGSPWPVSREERAGEEGSTFHHHSYT